MKSLLLRMPEIGEYIKQNWAGIFVKIFIIGFSVRVLYSLAFFIFKKICSKIEFNKKYNLFKQELVYFGNQQLSRQINSKKYLPNTHIEITNLKESLRFFCHPLLFCNKLIDEVNRLDFSYINEELSLNFGKKIAIPRMRKCKKLTFTSFFKKLTKISTIAKKNLAVLDSISVDEHSYWKSKKKLNNINYKNKLLNSKVLLILDDAGQGKTNLVCDLRNSFLKKMEIAGVLFFGSDFNSVRNGDVLKFFSTKLRNTDYDQVDKFITKTCKKTRKYFIVIIDALNESSVANFSEILDDFIVELLRNKFVKIILTCRSEYYRLNFKFLESSAYAENIIKIEGINSKLEDHEKERLFRTYLDSFTITWDSFSSSAYELLVDNFLLLRIFCEAYQGQHIGAIFNVHMFDLFENYYRQIRDKVSGWLPGEVTLEKIFCELISYMVKNKTYNDIPLQKIIDLAKLPKDIILRLIDENIFFRRDILNPTGVLLDAEVINFTFDEFKDFLIADYLSNVLLQEDRDDMVRFLNEEISPDKPLFEGVSKYLFIFSKKAQNSELGNVIEGMQWYGEKYIRYIFQMDDRYLKEDDKDKIRKSFFINGTDAEVILRFILHYRFDTSIYKNLNITLLYDILSKLDEENFNKKFLDYFKQRGDKSYYVDSQHDINLNHYFRFVSEQFESGKISNSDVELLFFLLLGDCGDNPFRKAKELFNRFYNDTPKRALQVISKYLIVENNFIKSRAENLYKKYNEI